MAPMAPMAAEEGGENRRRWAPSESDKTLLEERYGVDPFPSAAVRTELAARLNIAPRQVQVWFQNRRQKERAKNNAQKANDVAPPSPDSSSSASTKGFDKEVPPAPVSPPMSAPVPVSPPSSVLNEPRLTKGIQHARQGMPVLPQPPMRTMQAQPALHTVQPPPPVYTAAALPNQQMMTPNQQMMTLFFTRSMPQQAMAPAPALVHNNMMSGPNTISPEQLLDFQRQLKEELSRSFAGRPTANGAPRGISKAHRAMPPPPTSKVPPKLQGVPMDRRAVSMDAVEVLSSMADCD